MGSSPSKEDESTNSNMITKHSEELGDNGASKTDSSVDDGKETKTTNDKLGENINIITKHSEGLGDNGTSGTNSSMDDGKETKTTNDKLGEIINIITTYFKDLFNNGTSRTNSSMDDGKEMKETNDKQDEKSGNFDLIKATEKNDETPNDTQSETERNCFRSLYIKNLGNHLDSCELQKMFQKFGSISSAVVQTDEGGRSEGFGYVCFESSKSARLAMEEMNGIELHGRKLYVGQFMTKSHTVELINNEIERLKNLARSLEGTNVYVKNLNETIDDEILKNLFQPFGTITSAEVMRDGNGKSKEFGFVNFSKPEEAIKAISRRNGLEFKGKVLYVTLSQIKEESDFILGKRIQKAIPMQRTKKKCSLSLSPKNAAAAVTDAERCGQNYFQSMGHSTEPRRDQIIKRNTELVSSEIPSSCEKNVSATENSKGHQDQTVREEKQKEKRESRRERKKAAKVHAVKNRND